jgi:hypothetical protein
VSIAISVVILVHSLVVVAVFSRATTVSVSAGAVATPSTFSLLSTVGAVVGELAGRLREVFLGSGWPTFVSILLVHTAPRVGITAPALGTGLRIFLLLFFLVPVSQTKSIENRAMAG